MENKNIFDQMTEDEFYNMITSPVFHFMDLENKATEDPEGQRAKVDSYRQDFRARYAESAHGSGLEDVYTFFAAGFNAAKGIYEIIISMDNNKGGADNE